MGRVGFKPTATSGSRRSMGLKKGASSMNKLVVLSSILLLLAPPALAQQPASPLERYRQLEFPPTEDNFDKGWKERVALEYEIINSGDLEALRAGLKDKDRFVRSMAARALGILGDKSSAEALAVLLKDDPEYMVRIRAVEALGYLKTKPEAVEAALKDRSAGVQWAAGRAVGQVKSAADYASQVRQAYAG